MTEESKQYAPECYACPIGTMSMAAQSSMPDATEHLIKAGRELLSAFKSALDGLEGFLSILEDRASAAKKPESSIQAIPIRRETKSS